MIDLDDLWENTNKYQKFLYIISFFILGMPNIFTLVDLFINLNMQTKEIFLYSYLLLSFVGLFSVFITFLQTRKTADKILN